jgi:hypothetical protein
MMVFNTYPLRFPILQVPLGRALATVSSAAIRAYVDSIWLYNQPVQSKLDMRGPTGRENVGHCLRAFEAGASLDQRLLLWKRAHERWLAWRFEQKDRSIHLFDVCRCDIDYAVIAFAVEGLDNAGRKEAMDAIRNQMGSLEHQWHESITAITTEWYRLLSQFQPYARASSIVESGEDMLTDRQYYLPFNPVENTWLSLKFRMART